MDDLAEELWAEALRQAAAIYWYEAIPEQSKDERAREIGRLAGVIVASIGSAIESTEDPN
jgi:hypothetical protein